MSSSRVETWNALVKDSAGNPRKTCLSVYVRHTRQRPDRAAPLAMPFPTPSSNALLTILYDLCSPVMSSSSQYSDQARTHVGQAATIIEFEACGSLIEEHKRREMPCSKRSTVLIAGDRVDRLGVTSGPPSAFKLLVTVRAGY
eukprot:1689715-Rhodomonas_salina.1